MSSLLYCQFFLIVIRVLLRVNTLLLKLILVSVFHANGAVGRGFATSSNSSIHLHSLISAEHFVHEPEYRFVRDVNASLADVDTVLHHVEGGRFIGNLRLGVAAEVAATIK